MEAEAKAKDEAMQHELSSMRQALEETRAKVQSAPSGGAASAYQDDFRDTTNRVLCNRFLVRAPGGKLQLGPIKTRLLKGFHTFPFLPLLVCVLSLMMVGLLEIAMMKDKHKKDKKSKKDKKKKKKRKRSSSSSSSSSDSSQVGKQMLKALMKQLKEGSKKDKKSDDEGTDGEKPKNKAKEAEKIAFPKFRIPEQYRNWRIRVREAVVAASDKPDMAFECLSKVWAKESTEEQLRDPGGFVALGAKVLSAITNVLEGDFARQMDTFKEREAVGRETSIKRKRRIARSPSLA